MTTTAGRKNYYKMKLKWLKLLFKKKKNPGNSYLEGSIENCKSWEQSDLTEIIKVKETVHVKCVLS